MALIVSVIWATVAVIEMSGIPVYIIVVPIVRLLIIVSIVVMTATTAAWTAIVAPCILLLIIRTMSAGCPWANNRWWMRCFLAECDEFFIVHWETIAEFMLAFAKKGSVVFRQSVNFSVRINHFVWLQEYFYRRWLIFCFTKYFLLSDSQLAPILINNEFTSENMVDILIITDANISSFYPKLLIDIFFSSAK